MRIRPEGTGRLHAAGRALLACVAAVFACGPGGCMTSLPAYVRNGFKVGPNYQRPPAPLSAKWIDDGDPRVRAGAPNLATWWDVFDDPVLTDLIRQAYSSNLTLRAAGYQILEAQQQRRIACSELLPQSQAAAFSYSHNEISTNGGAATGPTGFFGTGLAPPAIPVAVTTPATPIAGVTVLDPGPPVSGTTSTLVNGGFLSPGVGTSRYFDNWATSLNMSWELDFWGLFRRNLEAASASLDQSVFNSDEMTVLLLANVASQYVEIRTLQRRLELARRNVALQEPLVAVLEQQYKTGVANSDPAYHQLKSNLENTRALIPALEITLRQANNALCALLGIPVQDLLPKLGDGTVPDPADPSKRVVRIPQPIDDTVVVGIPGELLLQRPDVKAAEAQLRIQNADIGIAEAEMYPHLGINGSIGLAANQFGKLFNQSSGTGSIGPSLTWNILNYGRLLANVRLQDQVYQQHVAEYQQAILNANQDAENALVAYLRSIEQERHLRESAEAAASVSAYYVRQLRVGFLPQALNTPAFVNQLFTTINFQVTQQDVAAQAEGNIALNLILLYRALGGGWQLRLKHDGACPGPAGAPGLPAPGPQAASPNAGTPLPRPAPPAAVPEALPAPKPLPPPPLPGKGPAPKPDDDRAVPPPGKWPTLELDSGGPAPPAKGPALELDDRP